MKYRATMLNLFYSIVHKCNINNLAESIPINQIRLLDKLKLDKIMYRIKHQSLSVIVYVVVYVDKKSPAL